LQTCMHALRGLLRCTYSSKISAAAPEATGVPRMRPHGFHAEAPSLRLKQSRGGLSLIRALGARASSGAVASAWIPCLSACRALSASPSHSCVDEDVVDGDRCRRAGSIAAPITGGRTAAGPSTGAAAAAAAAGGGALATFNGSLPAAHLRHQPAMLV
jgi:hypothetical protein